MSEEEARELGWRYNAVDANNDGDISMSEWKNRSSAAGRQGQQRQQRQQRQQEQHIGDIDTNNDNEISAEEWTEFMRGRYADAQESQQTQGEPVTLYHYYYFVM